MPIDGLEKTDHAGKPALLEAPHNDEDVVKLMLAEALKKVLDPQAAIITYPSHVVYTRDDRERANYEKGSQVQFVVVDNSRGLGRDQICIAILKNRGGNPHSFGFQLARALKGETESEQEIYIVRFTQTAADVAFQKGIVRVFGLSANVVDATGRFGVKINALPRVPNITRDHISNIASRWNEGGAQLLSVGVLTSLGSTNDVDTKDYEDTLHALQKGRINRSQVDRVIDFEREYQSARQDTTATNFLLINDHS